jgi:hypothetical protein
LRDEVALKQDQSRILAHNYNGLPRRVGDKGMMVRASAVISMFFAGSVISTWAYQLEQRENFYRQHGYYATQPSSGGHYYYHSYGHSWFAWGPSYSGGGWTGGAYSGSSSSSGISHGGFGSIGHAIGGHS